MVWHTEMRILMVGLDVSSLHLGACLCCAVARRRCAVGGLSRLAAIASRQRTHGTAGVEETLSAYSGLTIPPLLLQAAG